MNPDPWRDLPVVNLINWPPPFGPAGHPASEWWRDRVRLYRKAFPYLAADCTSAWLAFDQLPGTRLRWYGYANGELHARFTGRLRLIQCRLGVRPVDDLRRFAPSAPTCGDQVAPAC